MTLVLPWWSPLLKQIEHLETLASNCSLVGGNISCDAENMRAKAEQQFKALNIAKLFGLDDSISIDEYSLARYVRTEVGSGSPSDKVAVVEAAVNRAKMWGITPDQLLRLRQKSGPHRGFYGPIHATEAECKALGKKKGCAPYGRWAGTKRDPKPIDVIVAKLVMSGKTKDFARGADDQLGPSAGDSLFGKQWIYSRIDSLAKDRNYWVGLLPGVNHRKTMLFKKTSIDPSSPDGQKLIAQAKEWAHKNPPDWSKLPVEGGYAGSGPTTGPEKSGTVKKWVAIGLGVLGLGGAVFAASAQKSKRRTVPISAPPGANYVLYASDECPACQEFKPKLLEAIPASEIHTVSLDTDEGMEKAQDDGIRVLPTVIRVSDGKRFAGIDDPKRLLA